VGAAPNAFVVAPDNRIIYVSAFVGGTVTELDMFTDHRFAASMRAEQAAGKADGRADLFSAGTLVTAPKGHGTEYGMDIPTITAPGEAQAFVDARIAEGSDWIKIVYDDGHEYGISFATIDVPRIVNFAIVPICESEKPTSMKNGVCRATAMLSPSL